MKISIITSTSSSDKFGSLLYKTALISGKKEEPSWCIYNLEIIYMSFSEVFYTGLYSSLIGLVIAIMASCYKSKCSKIKMGCIVIERDVEIEEKIDENPIQSQSRL